MQTPQQMKISPASATGFWNELLFELYTKNENKVLLVLRVKGEGLRRDFTHFSIH